MDRPDISRLNKNRGLYLNVGFIAALSLTIWAFNYTVYETTEEYKVPTEMEEEELIPVQRTAQLKKTLPPPPSVNPSNEIFEEEVVFTPEPEPIDPIIVPDAPIVDPKPIVKVRPPAPKVVVPVEPIDEGPEMPFMVVEQMPRFAGCEGQKLNDSEMKQCSDKAMLEYIYSKIKYPSIARENGIEGTAVVSFVVEKDGSLTDLKVARDIGGGCGREVIRIVKNMPDWIAGEQRGRKVRVQFNLPVKFKLD